MGKSEITVPTTNPSGVPGSLRLAASSQDPDGLFFKAERHGAAGLQSVIGHLSEADARALAAWLAERYPAPDATAVVEEAPKPFEPGTPLVIVTDDARGYLGTPAGLPKGTPVVVERVAANDPANGYVVKALAAHGLRTAWVRPCDVAPSLPAAERPWAVGDEAIVTEDRPICAAFRTGDRVRLVADIGSRGPGVRAFEARGEDGRVFTLHTVHIRRP
ncbi:hypothetical protein [Micromonospora sp. KC213]|uniref:hypothetical protein n=1 Tax=Micromonospora sp. KC213 TaxID=2530378 RepID=UPI001052006D|nr:hypothetical protein [Micromonospora sp. KC213]TDC29978.1 hypothetical protein E1166_29415 [Micromonospora sp. KC213]